MPNLPSLLVTSNYPPRVGGMEEYYAQLARSLDEGPVWVSTPRVREGGPAPELASPRVNVRTTVFDRGSAHKFAWVVVWWLSTLPLTFRHGIRFLHCGNLTPTGYLGYWTRKLRGIPYAIYFHGMDVERAIRKLHDGGPRAAAIRRILRDAAVLFANSRDTRDRLLRLGASPDRITILHPGVDAGRFRPAEDTGGPRRGPGHESTLLTVGRYAARKGVDDVIRALPRIRERCPSRLVVAGREQEEHLVGLVRELGLEGHVTFLGEVAAAELPALYRSADVFVMPSREEAESGSVEGFGIVFLEAAASGVPSIGGRSGGMADAIADGETGYLVEPGNPDELVDRIVHLLSDHDLRATMGRKARDRVATRFSWEAAGRAVGERMRRAVS